MTDVLVLGAGLAGLAAARDLAAGGADVPCSRRATAWAGAWSSSSSPTAGCCSSAARWSARSTPPTSRWRGSWGWPPCRPTSPSRARLRGGCPRRRRGRPPARLHGGGRGVRGADRGLPLALARHVDPDGPWANPDAAALDAISVAGWMREQGATPAVLRMHELSALSMAGGSEERRSLLGVLRQVAVAGAEELYGSERWEGMRLATGSASLALRMGEELGDRVRLGAVVRRIDVAPLRRDRDPARRRDAAGRGRGLRAPRRAAARRGRHGRVGGAARPAPPPARQGPRSARPPRPIPGRSGGSSGTESRLRR